MDEIFHSVLLSNAQWKYAQRERSSTTEEDFAPGPKSCVVHYYSIRLPSDMGKEDIFLRAAMRAGYGIRPATSSALHMAHPHIFRKIPRLEGECIFLCQ